jgi:hypothetical protein
MRIARKLTLLALTAVAAMALAVPQSFAQNVEVEDISGGHCPAVTPTAHSVSGGCAVVAHSTSPILLMAHLNPTFEVLASSCDYEFTGHVGGDGTGFITGQTLTGDDCTTPPCNEGGAVSQALWPFGLRENAPASETLDLTLCIVNSAVGYINCQIDLDVVGSVGNYSLEAQDERCQNIVGYPNFEIHGHWAVEDQTIEIHHL